MINGNLEQFLDNGWEHDVILFYKGFYYYCNGNFVDGLFHYLVYKMRGCMGSDYGCSYYLYNGEPVDSQDLFEEINSDRQFVRKHFIEAKIFDGKSFWEVEKDLVWGEDCGGKCIKSLGDIEKIIAK